MAVRPYDQDSRFAARTRILPYLEGTGAKDRGFAIWTLGLYTRLTELLEVQR